eukprot:5291722-Prymnesium_polylepis.1
MAIARTAAPPHTKRPRPPTHAQTSPPTLRRAGGQRNAREPLPARQPHRQRPPRRPLARVRQP